MKRVLLVSAHPDDMEIGMGGTVAKMAATGDAIISVVITDGRRAPDPTSIGPDKMAETRKTESQNACRSLGIIETVTFGFASVSTERDIADASEKMVELIGSFQPDEIYTLHPDLDRHPSHRMTGMITVDALERSARNSVKLWAYEVWGLFAKWDRFEDITEQIEKKRAAIAEHRSQVAAVPYVDGVVGLNRWRAVFADPHQSEVAAEYAEVFIRLN
jgi:N-acetylglucosamine malate deacetylase 1